MNRSRRCAALCVLCAAAPAYALTISGQVTLNGAPVASVAVVGPNATCSVTDAAGNYVCTVPAGWNGTLAAYRAGYVFTPPSLSYSNLASSQPNQDFAGDERTGLRVETSVYRPSNARFYLDYTYDHVADAVVPFGVPGDTALAGDVDGNGVTDFVIYRGGAWYADLSLTGNAGAQFAFGGVAGDVPLLADLNGDGIDDLVIYRAGTWYVSTHRDGNADAIYHFGGVAGDIPLLGDFDGDGIADLVIYRAGTWFIDTNRDGNPDIVANFGGVAGEQPVVMDYDGDGRSDLAVVRDGTWFVNTQLDGSLQARFIFGTAGDRPVAGSFSRANTLFVKAGATCTVACSQATPYGSIQTAWKAAADGAVIRVAGGTYAENLVFSYPGNQYSPGKFGKNNIRLLGVSRLATVVAPPTGDAVYLQGAAGYILARLRLQSNDTAAGKGRGLVTAGGTGSVLPTFPGSQLALVGVDVVENHDDNVLLTGTSNASIQYSRLSRSRTDDGLKLFQASYARVRNSALDGNGYTVSFDPATTIPDAGRGVDVRDDSEVDVARSSIQQNAVFGVIGINQSVVRLNANTIASTGLNGIIVCGAAANDRTVAYVSNNWVAGNGINRPDLGWNGMEVFTHCIGSQTISGNTFIGNSLNGLFVGSGTAAVTGNGFMANAIGITLYTDTTIGSDSSSTNTNVTLYNNVFDANRLDGLFTQRVAGSTLALNVTVGGSSASLKNIFRNHRGFHAIGCETGGENIVCSAGGNTFINNVDNIEATCPATCKP